MHRIANPFSPVRLHRAAPPPDTLAAPARIEHLRQRLRATSVPHLRTSSACSGCGRRPAPRTVDAGRLRVSCPRSCRRAPLRWSSGPVWRACARHPPRTVRRGCSSNRRRAVRRACCCRGRPVRLDAGRLCRRLRLLPDRPRRAAASVGKRRDRRAGRARARAGGRSQGRVHGHGRAGAQPRQRGVGDRTSGRSAGIGHKNSIRVSTVGNRVFEQLAPPRSQACAGLVAALGQGRSARGVAAARARTGAGRTLSPRRILPRATGHPIQFQWTLIEGVNDGDDD